MWKNSQDFRRYIYIYIYIYIFIQRTLEIGENEMARVAIYFECGHASSTNNVSYLATTTTDCSFSRTVGPWLMTQSIPNFVVSSITMSGVYCGIYYIKIVV